MRIFIMREPVKKLEHPVRKIDEVCVGQALSARLAAMHARRPDCR